MPDALKHASRYVQAELPVQQHIGKCIGLEERHAPIHNNAEGDADADIGKQRKPSAVFFARCPIEMAV